MTNASTNTRALMDQAAELRRLFARKQVRFAPVISRPYVARGSVKLDQLCHAVRNVELRSLAADASRTAGARAYQPSVRSRAAAERLGSGLGYLDVDVTDVNPGSPGVPARQPARAFLHEVAATMPDADIVLVHAATPDLMHLFNRHRGGTHAPRFMLLCADPPPAIVSTCASLKLLALRGGMKAHSLLMKLLQVAQAGVATALRLARRAHGFAGMVQQHAIRVSHVPDADANLPAMYRLTEELLSRSEAVKPPVHGRIAAAASRPPFHAQFS